MPSFNPNVFSILNRMNPGLSAICRRHLNTIDSGSESKLPLVKFTELLKKNYTNELGNFFEFMRPEILDLVTSDVVQIDIQDIELEDRDKYGHIFAISKGDVNLRYGDKGISASKFVTPKNLLKYDFAIPSGVFGLISVQKHVPIMFEMKDPANTFLLMLKGNLLKVSSHEENIGRYRLDCLAQIDKPTLSEVSDILQKRILDDKEVEMFFEEITAPISKPSEYNNSSTTGMIFRGNDGQSSPMHYHPGWRVLIIYTTDIPSGALLNFCGINEDPSIRTDCSVRVDFPSNSISMLSFPPYVHHKFFGSFVCTSEHPKEGEIFLQNYFNKNFAPDVGFLEANTKFSVISNPEIILEQIKWQISKPESVMDSDKSKSRSL